LTRTRWRAYDTHDGSTDAPCFAYRIKDDRVPATSQQPHRRSKRAASEPSASEPRILVACPDARPPAYEAVAGFAKSGRLESFHTGYYYGGADRTTVLARQYAPCHYLKLRKRLKRRHHPAIPASRVTSHLAFDLALAVESRCGSRVVALRRQAARWRTDQFDRQIARAIDADRPDVAFVFSDVASRHALPRCRELGIPTILSMVHGDVREEREVLEREAARSPEFFSIYLADGPVDRDELDWLHQRRLNDLDRADRILVPSEHIREELIRHGTDGSRIAVVPYAADTRRFRPDPSKRHDDTCTFLFTGGITQRKGIKDLLDAWRLVRRPGWRLRLLGGLPANPAPLEPYRDEVEWLGRVGHGEVARIMASADVFVFPSLFEGSAVVTYEALACGLPSVLTPSAGSVARQGLEAEIVSPADPEALATAMARLGGDPEYRAELSKNARARALDFTWTRYQTALDGAVDALLGRDREASR
jgi:glycosyltransferase involved in cell wall biosynthesis